ncbi:MAG: recombinase family protein [Candidatus Thermoplasmatota archaeon]|nr:recombinase family protein [Candidatus Thermoplasmatota archaeon]
MHNGKKQNPVVVGYVRVSTDEQAKEGYSIEAQKTAIEGYAQSQGWTVSNWYVDEGRSAYTKDEHRPEYSELMKQVESWDIVVAKWLNRFWRRTSSALKWVESLESWKKDFVCVRENLDTSSPTGKMFLTVLSAFNQLESDQTSERVKDAFAQKFESEDDPWFTKAPLGFDLVCKEHGPGCHDKTHKRGLRINEAEAETVRAVFRLIHRYPTLSLAAVLNERGFRGKEGKQFYQATVLYILHNPVYAGYVYYDGVLKRASHGVIIAAEGFNAVQELLAKRTRKHQRKPLTLSSDRVLARRMAPSGNSASVYVLD